MFTAVIRLAFMLPLVPAMLVLDRLFGESAIPESFVRDIDTAWATIFPEQE